MITDSSSPAEFYEDNASLLSLDSSVFFSEPALPSDDPLDFFIINVGGSRYILSQELLASHPETRLGKLALSSRDSALDLCDDADFLENEFFFDRNSQTFQYIMNFYKTGHLHVREELCVISFLQEIEYWGIDELRIDSCCRDKYYRRKEMKESLDIRKDAVIMDNKEEDFTGILCQDLRQRLWDLMEKPDSSKAAKTFGTLSMFFVVVSILNMALISLDFTILGAPIILEALEYICIIWFTGELVLRFMCVRDKCRFSRSVVNIIDLLAILPFYVTLAVESLHGGSTELENVGRVVQVLRLLRFLRMLKLGRHSTGDIPIETYHIILAYNHTLLVEKFGKFFFFFERSLLCSPRLHLFDQACKNSNTAKYFYYLNCFLYIYIYFKVSFILVMAKLNFHQPLLQSSVSHIICWFGNINVILMLILSMCVISLKMNNL